MAKKQNDLESNETPIIEPSLTENETPIYDASVVEDAPVETHEDAPVVESPVEPVETVEGTLIDYITAIVPHNYTLRIDNHKIINVAQGTQKMEREHAEHWFSVANGVTIFEG